MPAHEVIGLWAGAICVLAIFSILYRENPVFRFFEHLYIGLGAGVLLYITWTETLLPKWWMRMVSERDWRWILALVAGSLFYFIYSRRLLWLARLIMGFFFGWGAATVFKGFFPLFAPQIASSFKSLRPTPELSFADTILNHWVFVIALLCVLSYFFFSVEHQRSRLLARSSSLGRWLLMISFGAIFGNTIMGRLSLLIGRLKFLLDDWLGSYFPSLIGRG